MKSLIPALGFTKDLELRRTRVAIAEKKTLPPLRNALNPQ